MQKDKEWKNYIVPVLACAYSLLSCYCIYLMLPEGLRALFWMLLIFCGGIFVAIGGWKLVVSLREDTSVSKYLKMVVLAAYLAPIVIIAAYYLRLEKSKDVRAVLTNDDIYYNCSVEYSVEDPENPDSEWEITLYDKNNEKIVSDNTYVVKNSDIVTGTYYIHCDSHDIEDTEFDSNISDDIISRDFAIWAGDSITDNVSRTFSSELEDANGNDINIDVTITIEKEYFVWTVLNAQLDDRGRILRKFNVLGKECPNLVEYTNEHGGDVISDTAITRHEDGIISIIDSETINGHSVYTWYGITEAGIYDAVYVVTYDYYNKDDVKKYAELLRSEVIKKYGISDSEPWENNGTSWVQRWRGLEFDLAVTVDEGEYSVALMINSSERQE